MAKQAFKVTVTTLPCSCGGTMRPVKIEGAHDVSAELGIPATLRGTAQVVQCDRCDGVAVPGAILEEISNEAVLVLLQLERRLSGAEARFLRKAALGIGQEELARRIGVTRVTVARWEAGRSLSAEHDFGLRALVGARLLKLSGLSSGRWKKQREQLVRLMTGMLQSARTDEAPPKPAPLSLGQKAA